MAPSDVRTGTQRDAILFACGANATHGLRRTNDDKRKAVGVLLADAVWSKMSDREIARLCKVSNMLVAVVRNPPGESSFTPKPPPSPPAEPESSGPPAGGNSSTPPELETTKPKPKGDGGTAAGGGTPADPPAAPTPPTEADKNAEEAHGDTTIAELLDETRAERWPPSAARYKASACRPRRRVTSRSPCRGGFPGRYEHRSRRCCRQR